MAARPTPKTTVEQIHVNDTPLIIFTIKDPNVIPPAVLDVSAYSTLQVMLKGPDGVTDTYTGSFTTDGTDGKIEYQVGKTEIDQSGFWQAWVTIFDATLNFRTNSFRFEVFPE